MTDVVDIPDNGSDVEIQEDRNSAPHPSTLAFDELRNLKREMEMRGNQLGKTWSELSRLMTKYQAQLIEKHEQYESSISAEEHGRLTQLESIIDKNRLENQRLSKSVSDLEQKLLDKDTEIVRLRTEVHKSRNEVSMKDSLIQKLQNQMAQEAMEYQTEINSLKEILEIEKSQNDGANVELSAKRRRLVMPSQASHRQFVSRENSLIKSEPGLQSCKQQTVFSAPRSTQLSHTQTSDSTLEPGYSDAADDLAASTSMAPDDIMHESGDAAYYKQAGGYENDDESNSGDVMSDLLEQKHMIDSNASQVEPQLMIPNVHGAQQSTPQIMASPPFANRCGRNGGSSGRNGGSSGRNGGNGRGGGGSRGSCGGDMGLTSATTEHYYGNSDSEHERLPSSASGCRKSKCPTCSKLITESNYARHRRTHLGIRPFQCTLCAKTFSELGNGVRHVLVLHGQSYANAKDFLIRVG